MAGWTWFLLGVLAGCALIVGLTWFCLWLSGGTR